MTSLVVIVDMRSNSPQILPLVEGDEGQRMAVFESLRDIALLKRTHILGTFPWWVVNLDWPGLSPSVFP